MVLGPLVPPVLWMALLECWLVCCGCDMGLEGHHFLVIYNTVGIIPDLESFGIVHVN